MKYLNYIIAIAIISTTTSAFAQEIDKSLAEAKSAYSAKKLEETRFALENVLREINIALGKQVLNEMPKTLGALNADPNSDDATSMALLYTGLNVTRRYIGSGADAELMLMSDSPLLAGINSILSLPAMMLNSQTQKVIKIEGYKALIQKQEDGSGYSLSVPNNNSLISLNYNGSISETEFLKIANSLPVGILFRLAQ